MAYTPDNNPYIPGDPYSYDLKWQVENIKHMQTRFGELDDHVQEATKQADRAEQEADRAAGRADFATEEADRAEQEADRAAGRADFATEEADRATEEADRAESEADRSKNYADNIADPVSGIVTSWLAEHITQPTTPAIDTSLTVSGAAADAKVTGDAIRKIDDSIPQQLDFEPGYINLEGVVTSSEYSCISPIISVNPDDTITLASGVEFAAAVYDLIDGEYVFNRRENNWHNTFTFSTSNYVRLVLRFADGSLMDPEEASASVLSTNITLPDKYILRNDLDSIESDVTKIRSDLDIELFKEFIFTPTAISSTGEETASDTRCSSEVFENKIGDTITVSDGYQFRMATYNKIDDDYVFDYVDNTWVTTITFSSQKYRRITIRKTDNANITPDEAAAALARCDSPLPYTYQLKENVEDLMQAVQNISSTLPVEYVLYNKNVLNTGEIVDSDSRCITDIIQLKPGDQLTARDMEFRWAVYTKNADDTYTFSSMPGTWYTAYNFSNYRYVRLIFRINEGNPDISPLYVSNHITDTNINIPSNFNNKERIKALETAVNDLTDNFKLNIPLTGNQNMMWSMPLSITPYCQYLNRVRNQLYWTYTTSDGFSGVACMDFKTGNVYKTHLKKNDVDDHNAPAVLVRSNGDIIVAYADGHNTGSNMYFRKATTKECIDQFTPSFVVNTGGATSYSELLEYNNNIYCFYRKGNQNWYCLISRDGGDTWSNYGCILTSPMQYYCKVQYTTTPGVLRLCVYSNPEAADPAIRMGFLHLDTGDIYNSDNNTVIGNISNGVSYSAFNIIITPPSGKTQRLFDVAITPIAEPSILYCTFSLNEAADSIYKWYNVNQTIDIVAGGQALWIPKYQLACIFVDNTTCVLGRGELGTDYIEMWSLSSTPAKLRDIYSEPRGSIGIRNGRPITDGSGRYIMWHRGYYNPNSYTDFNADAMAYSIEDDEIILR